MMPRWERVDRYLMMVVVVVRERRVCLREDLLTASEDSRD